MDCVLARLYLYIFEDQKPLLLIKGRKEKGIFALAYKPFKNY
jgi:hypothetical protein